MTTTLTNIDWLALLFLAMLGGCVGSFLNVVVYRLPRVEEPAGCGVLQSFWLSLGALIYPPSTCPKCGRRLAWYDNVPVFGWLFLRGKCRYCKLPISPRYPLVEGLVAALFVMQYLALFGWRWGPCQMEMPLNVIDHWPVLLIQLWLIASLLAASLIDAEHFHIPLWICWILAAVGVTAHAAGIGPTVPGNLHFGPITSAMTLAGAVGLIVSLLLLRFGVVTRSFADGEPLLEKDRPDPTSAASAGDTQEDDWPPARIRAEMRREMLFLLPPLGLACAAGWLAVRSPAFAGYMEALTQHAWIGGAVGALCGAFVGAIVVWLFRILGSYGFGREAMGMGDVHLMFGVGAAVGPGVATVAFFVAPVFGLTYALWMLLARKRKEVPFGPYLSLGTYAVLLAYCPVYDYLSTGVLGLQFLLQNWLTGTGG